MMVERHRRTIAKTLSYRIIGVTLTITGIYIYGGNLADSIVVGLAINMVKVCIFYGHERFWNRIQFGREMVSPPEYNI